MIYFARTFTKASILAALMLLVGCETMVTKTVVVEKPYYVSMPASFIAPCTATVPPVVKNYLERDPLAQESTLVEYIRTLLGDLRNCDTRTQSARDFDARQKEIIEKGKKP